ncbi:MAG: hypothetical protein ACPIOQ_58210, partial [Promethearchaeia archaeon]
FCGARCWQELLLQDTREAHLFRPIGRPAGLVVGFECPEKDGVHRGRQSCSVRAHEDAGRLGDGTHQEQAAAASLTMAASHKHRGGVMREARL